MLEEKEALMKTRVKDNLLKDRELEQALDDGEISEELHDAAETGEEWQAYNLPAGAAADDFQKEWEKLRPFALKLFRELQDSSLD